jgi:Tfp pilus assembly protein PilF
MIDGCEKPPREMPIYACAWTSIKGGALMETRTREDRLMAALECLERGAWQDAHVIVQQDKSVEAAWLHGIVHTLEGDFENAEHWYRKARRAFPGPGSVDTEIAAAREVLGQRG